MLQSTRRGAGERKGASRSRRPLLREAGGSTWIWPSRVDFFCLCCLFRCGRRLEPSRAESCPATGSGWDSAGGSTSRFRTGGKVAVSKIKTRFQHESGPLQSRVHILQMGAGSEPNPTWRPISQQRLEKRSE
uniref:Uncharacterized protein n=1 Tax=Sphaerodactylus townsendi TaxID=933632 RepID=A0ACB8G6N4_9SAUR